jgi:hypothetical protein
VTQRTARSWRKRVRRKRLTERGLARGERGDLGAVQLIDTLLIDDHVTNLTR